MPIFKKNSKGDPNRGEKIFKEARHVKDSLGFLASVKLELQELFDFLTGTFKEETGWELIIVAFVDGPIDDLTLSLALACGTSVPVLKAATPQMECP